MAWTWKNRSDILGKSGEGSMFVVAGKKVVPRCHLQLASETRPYTPWTDRGTDEFLKYFVAREIAEES